MTRMFTLCFFGTLLFLASHAPAQTTHTRDLAFKRITLNLPNTEIYFQAKCDGLPVYNLDRANIRVQENGKDITDFTLTCADASARCASSVALVFDESGSTGSGDGNGYEKAAGHAYTDMMDGVLDQAAVIGFDENVYMLQTMTSKKKDLNNAVDMLVAMGSTAIYDGMFAGLKEVNAKGTNPCRAVILMTDGGDNSSTIKPAEVVAFANRYHIHIFTIGLGSGVDAFLLESIALQTGGKFYLAPSPGELSSMYQEIYGFIRNSFEECTIAYRSPCNNDTARTVSLTINNLCDSILSKSKAYTAPLKPELILSRDSVVLCFGDVATLEAPLGFSKYAWSNGDTTQTLTTSLQGTYTVTATDTGGCVYTSKPIRVYVLPLPVPTITDAGNALYAGEYSKYQWYRNDTMTVEAGRGYNLKTSGEY